MFAPPTFVERFDVQPPVYIRKIDSRARWEIEGNNIKERAQKVADSLFKYEVSSIWLVKSDVDFYGVIASLSANRTPKNQIIDFICVTESDLDKAGVEIEAIPEGDCLDVQKSHFNAPIDKATALRLCENLIENGRKAHRCQKAETVSILKHQESRGCKATESTLEKCECQEASGNTQV